MEIDHQKAKVLTSVEHLTNKASSINGKLAQQPAIFTIYNFNENENQSLQVKAENSEGLRIRANSAGIKVIASDSFEKRGCKNVASFDLEQ